MNTEKELKKFRRKLEKSWSRDTCFYKGDFNPECPSGGQCFVTALCIQDILGGNLLCGWVNKIWHFWNRLPSGQEVDLTSDQFKGGDGIHRHPRAIVSYRKWHVNRKNKRYLLLKKRIEQQKGLNRMSAYSLSKGCYH